ncbi:hypothetical protein VI06_19795 [Aquitalea magnusonii]|nr:hypothetical protein VI06_19795 [Aquitalea magnusonii]
MTLDKKNESAQENELTESAVELDVNASSTFELAIHLLNVQCALLRERIVDERIKKNPNEDYIGQLRHDMEDAWKERQLLALGDRSVMLKIIVKYRNKL